MARVVTVDHFALLRAEVQPAGQLAHDDDVHALQFLRLQRRGIDQRRMHFHGAQIRKDLQAFAQGQQAALGSIFGFGIIPLGAAHCAEQHRIRLLARLQRFVGQRRTVRIDRAAAHQMRFVLKRVAEFLRDDIQHAHGFSHHFRADAITGKKNDFGFQDILRLLTVTMC